MKIFISWSGERSQIIAEYLRDWLPKVIQSVEPWMSTPDIDIGARWNSDLSKHLADAHFGIICLTPENMKSAWLLFEAGALSKTIDKSFVCPYLFDLEPSDIEGPLVQFQAAKSQFQDTKKLIHSINQALEEKRIPETILDESFKLWWPQLENVLKSVPKKESLLVTPRTDSDMIKEILDLVRVQARNSITNRDNASIYSLSTEVDEYVDKIHSLLRDNPIKLTAFEISQKIGCSRTVATRALRKLQEIQKVDRIYTDDRESVYVIRKLDEL